MNSEIEKLANDFLTDMQGKDVTEICGINPTLFKVFEAGFNACMERMPSEPEIDKHICGESVSVHACWHNCLRYIKEKMEE